MGAKKENGHAAVASVDEKNNVKDAGDEKPVASSKVVRLPKPDRSGVDAQIAALNDSIEAQQLRITEVRQAIESKRGNRKSMNGDVQNVRNELVQVRTEFKRELEIKQNLRTKLQAADLARDTLRNELKAMKDKLNFVKVNDIESEMKRIEERMAHTTLTLDEEKRLVSQLASLNKSRDVVKGFGTRQEQLSLDEEARKEIVDKIKAQDTILNEIKAREGVLQQQMKVAKTKEDSVSGDFPALIAEREACIATIKGIRGEIRKLRDDFRELENAYYSQQRELRDVIKKEREERKLQWIEEKKQRDADRKRRDMENAPPPYHVEITICEQLTAYLSKFLPSEAPAQADDAAATSTSEDNSGLVLKQRTEDEEGMGSMFTGTGKKGGKKKKKGGKKNDPAALTETSKLPHSIETYTSFSTIGVTVPITVADVKPALESIEVKAKEYEVLSKEGQKKREEALAAMIAAENEAAESNGEGADSAEKKETEGEGEAKEEDEKKKEEPASDAEMTEA